MIVKNVPLVVSKMDAEGNQILRKKVNMILINRKSWRRMQRQCLHFNKPLETERHIGSQHAHQKEKSRVLSILLTKAPMR